MIIVRLSCHVGGGVQWVSEPQLESVGIHTIQVVLVKILVPDKAKVAIETESSTVGHLCLQHHLHQHQRISQGSSLRPRAQ